MDFLITVAPSFAESPEWLEYRDSEPVKGDYAPSPKATPGQGQAVRSVLVTSGWTAKMTSDPVLTG